MVYLDNAATTFPKPEEVYSVMDKVNKEMCVNAGRGSYRIAREVSKIIDDTKNCLLKLINSDNAQVIFSPSITIALNQIIRGISWTSGSTVYISPYEHNAVARTLNYLSKETNIVVKQLPIDKNTFEIDLEKVKYEFSKNKPDVIICTHVSNVTGYVLPIKEIFEEGKKYNCITIVDSAQSLGLIPLDVRQVKADIIAFAGHKTLYGPFGIGGFINVSAVPLEEFIVGGTGSDSLNVDMPQQGSGKYEAASSNIVAIAGLQAALNCLDVEENYKIEKKLTEYLVSKMKKIEGIKLYIPGNEENHIGIVSFTVVGICSDDVGTILDEDFDIAVRTGYHCAPYIHNYLADKESLGTVRVGLGQFNGKRDIDNLIDAINEIITS